MIVFIADKYLAVDIINSQIIGLAKYLQPQKQKVICIWGTKENKGRSILNIDNCYNIRVVYFRRFKEISSIIRAADYVYLRSYLHIINILYLKWCYNHRMKIIYDFRGLFSAESYYKHRQIIRSATLYFLEFFMYAVSDYICSVSDALAKLLRHIYYDRDITVIPCGVETVYKRQYPIDRNYVKILYCGSINQWQQFDRCINVYKDICKNIPALLSIYTPHCEMAKQYLQSINIKATEIEYVRHDDLMYRMRGHDYGLLLREDHIINRVASPIKAIEYLACGIIPLVTDNIGDISSDIKRYKIGFIMDEKFEMDLLRSAYKDEDIGDRIYKYACEHTWAQILKVHPINATVS